MSKNHPHDNIYSILGKLEALQPTPQEKHDATVKQIYESVEAQGSILKGLRDVSSTEAKLRKEFSESDFSKVSKAIQKTGKSKASADAIAAAAGREKLGQKEMTRRSVAGRKNEAMETCEECAMGECSTHGMSEGELTHAGNVTRHTKTDFPGYPSTNFDDNEQDGPRGKGRPRIHAKKEPTGNGRGRPTSDTPTYGNKMNDPFGRSPEKAPAGTPGRKIAGKGNEDSAIGGHYGESTIVRKPGSTVHTKTDYPGYPETDYGTHKGERGRGRPQIHAKKEPTGLGRGRPTTAKPSIAPKMNDPFGRVPEKAPKGKTGTVHAKMSMDENMALLGKRLSRIYESINFKKMAEETHQSIDELMAELQNDIANYKATGDCSDKLNAFLNVHHHGKRQVADETIDPTNPRDYEIPAVQRKAAGQAPLTHQDIVQKDRKPEFDFHQRAHGKPHPDSMEYELNELAALAGIHESTGFDQAPTPELTINTTLDSEGKKSININAEGPQADMLLQLLKMSGLESQAPAQVPAEIDVVADEGNEFTGKLKDTPQGGEFELGGNTYTDTSNLDESPEADYKHVIEYTKHYMIAKQIDALASEDVDAIATELGLPMEEVIDYLYDVGLAPVDLDEGSALDPDSIKLLVRWIDDDLENGTPYEQSLILSAEEMNITPQEADKIYRANSPDSDYIPPVNFGDMDEGNAFSGKLAQARAQHKDKFDVDGHEYEVKEADAPVDEPTIEPVNNAHRNKYASMKASTMNPGEGDFGEKNMYGGRGDNRMTQQPNRPSKPVKSVKEAFAQMEAQLANEYESIKKVSK